MPTPKKPSTRKKARIMKPLTRFVPTYGTSPRNKHFARFRVEYPGGEGYFTMLGNRLAPSKARQLGLMPESKAVTIAFFEPHGFHDREHGGKGIGTVAFRKAIAHAKIMGAKAVIISTLEPLMQRIIERHGFKLIEGETEQMKTYGKRVRPRPKKP